VTVGRHMARHPPAPRCACGSTYLSGSAPVPLEVVLGRDGDVRIAGPAYREIVVETITCKACGRTTSTADLPGVEVDVAAVLRQLDDAAAADIRRAQVRIPCGCGAAGYTATVEVVLLLHISASGLHVEVLDGGSEPTLCDQVRCTGARRESPTAAGLQVPSRTAALLGQALWRALSADAESGAAPSADRHVAEPGAITEARRPGA
jgi:hypothetical protein